MSTKVKQIAADVAQMAEESVHNAHARKNAPVNAAAGIGLGAINTPTGPGRPKGAQNKQLNRMHRMPYQPEAIGTFASGAILGAVLKYDGDYLMVVPNPEFPTVVRMDLETAALRLNVCTECRIFDLALKSEMAKVNHTNPNLGI